MAYWKRTDEDTKSMIILLFVLTLKMRGFGVLGFCRNHRATHGSTSCWRKLSPSVAVEYLAGRYHGLVLICDDAYECKKGQ